MAIMLDWTYNISVSLSAAHKSEVNVVRLMQRLLQQHKELQKERNSRLILLSKISVKYIISILGSYAQNQFNELGNTVK